MSQEDNTIVEEAVGTRAKTNFSMDAFFTKNSKSFTIGGVVLIALAGLAYLYFGYLKPKKEKEANVAIFMAERYWGMDSIDNALNGHDGHLGMVDIADEYGSTLAGQRANFYLGVAKMKESKFEEAITHLEKVDFEDLMVGPLSVALIGDCYVELDNVEKAAEYYSRAANKSSNDFTTPYCLQKAGRAYEKTGNWEKAAAAYKRIQSDFGKTRFADGIEQYIARAEASAK